MIFDVYCLLNQYILKLLGTAEGRVNCATNQSPGSQWKTGEDENSRFFNHQQIKWTFQGKA